MSSAPVPACPPASCPAPFPAPAAIPTPASPSFIPRHDRDLARGRRAAAAVQAAGGDAMAQAKAAIDATFDGANAHNLLKGRVDWMIRRGADDFDVRMRYGRRAQMLLALPLEAAMSRVEFWYRAERKAHQIACAFGRGHAAALIPLQSIRVLLRLLRRKRLHAQWPALVDAVAAPRFHLIAAE